MSNESKTLEKEAQAQAEALAAEIGGWAVQADVADPVQVGRMVDNVLDKFCQLDILICNAGIAQQYIFHYSRMNPQLFEQS